MGAQIGVDERLYRAHRRDQRADAHLRLWRIFSGGNGCAGNDEVRWPCHAMTGRSRHIAAGTAPFVGNPLLDDAVAL